MTDLDREEPKNILMRHGIYSPTKGVLDAMSEVRDLAIAKARREALENSEKAAWSIGGSEDPKTEYTQGWKDAKHFIVGAIRSLIDQPSLEPKSAGAELRSEPFKEGRGAAKVASASVPAEPDPRCSECQVDNGFHLGRCSQYKSTPNPKAWREVLVTAGELVEKLQHLGLNADGKSNAALMWDLAIAIERAARAKLVEK